MPLPDDKPQWRYDELVDAMQKLGWRRSITVRRIDYVSSTDQILLRTFKFETTNPKIRCVAVPCDHRDLYFVEQRPTGVIMTCAFHRMTATIPWEWGVLINEEEVDFATAEKIVKETGQLLPPHWLFLRKKHRPYIQR